MSDFIRNGGVQKLQDGEFIFQVSLFLSPKLSSLLVSENVMLATKIPNNLVPKVDDLKIFSLSFHLLFHNS